jgi:pre-mRNA-splicing factor ATP-dependent RNA helicase DHX38/PRP16
MADRQREAARAFEEQFYDEFEDGTPKYDGVAPFLRGEESAPSSWVGNAPRRRPPRRRRAESARDAMLLWEQTQMGLGGASARPLPQEAVGDGAPDAGRAQEDDDEVPVSVLVHAVKPPFLHDVDVSLRAQEAVALARSAGADIVMRARAGSATLARARAERERRRADARVGEVADTRIGAAIGLGGPRSRPGRSADGDGDGAGDGADGSGSRRYADAFARKGAASADERARIRRQREALPVFAARRRLVQLIREHAVVVVVGETGSGKTTQLAQYLREEGFARHGVIACTQPRRVAAVSVARRVAEEMDVALGEEVGYAIRFETCTGPRTEIKFMTDGVLLRESLTSQDLDAYSVVIMDEAHERSLNTDVLFGIMRQMLTRRSDLKLVVTSATLDADRFAAFFGDAPVYHVAGRTYPVDVLWARSVSQDYVDDAVNQAVRIHLGGRPGDILLFMTGRDDVEITCALIEQRLAQQGGDVPLADVLPLYSQLAIDRQAQVFQPSARGARKIVVATNIAETSLTVDGIAFVIDCGYSNLKMFNPRVGMDALRLAPISRASADQRAGRAGRTGPGQCYRLYNEATYRGDMLQSSVPEIQRTHLAHVVLLLKSLGVHDLLQFPFMDPPPRANILSAMYQLWMLGALGHDGELTEVGREMSRFPLDPPLAKMLVYARVLGCTEEIVTIVSMLSVPNVFLRPAGREEDADRAREKFFHPESDHVTLYNVYHQWAAHHADSAWADDHFLVQRALRQVREIRGQLSELIAVRLVSCGHDWDRVQRCVCAASFVNAAKLRGMREYVNLRTGTPCNLHPSSALFAAGFVPEYVVYHELVLTSKEYMRVVTAVDPYWLEDLGPMFFSVDDGTRDPAALQRDRGAEVAAAMAAELADSRHATGLRERIAAIDRQLHAESGSSSTLSWRSKRAEKSSSSSDAKSGTKSLRHGSDNGGLRKMPRRFL